MIPFRCRCGRRTTHPYRLGDDLLCVVCAGDLRPDVVSKRVADDARRYTRSSPKARHDGGPGWSRWSG